MHTYDILRKDFKSVTKTISINQAPSIGISAATMRGNTLLSRNDFLEASLRFIVYKKLEALIVMFLYFEDNSTKPNRQIVVLSLNNELKERLCNFILCNAELEMVERQFELINDLDVNIGFYDHNMKWSRKQILPLISTFV